VAAVKRRNNIGWISMGLLVLAWVFTFSTPWLPDAWILRAFAVSTLAALVSLMLAIVCARKGSRWWYLLAGSSLVSGLILLADLVVGS
jgi:hypothetical protein